MNFPFISFNFANNAFFFLHGFVDKNAGVPNFSLVN